MLTVFQKEEAAEIFSSLGGEKGHTSGAISVLSTKSYDFNKTVNVIFASLAGEKGYSQNTVTLQTTPNCSCSTASDYCSWTKAGASCSGGSCNSQVGVTL